MIYLEKWILSSSRDGYPFIPLVCNSKEFTFTKPVTVLCGDNGCGKTTLVRLIAEKMNCYKIGQQEEKYNTSGAADCFTTIKKAHPTKRFYFSAEDFIRYIQQYDRMKNEAIAALKEIQSDQSMSAYAKSLASMPHNATLFELERLYDRNLVQSSHGEGFLSFFSSRLSEKGFYLLDEPEAALSYENQYRLAYAIHLAAKERQCQFIIATHSPILTAIPGAELWQVRDDCLERTDYEQLENIQFLKIFLARNGNGMFEE